MYSYFKCAVHCGNAVVVTLFYSGVFDAVVTQHIREEKRIYMPLICYIRRTKDVVSFVFNNTATNTKRRAIFQIDKSYFIHVLLYDFESGFESLPRISTALLAHVLNNYGYCTFRQHLCILNVYSCLYFK